MKHFNLSIVIVAITTLLACNQKPSPAAAVKQVQPTHNAHTPNPKTIVQNAITAHGGKAYDSAYFGFTFRNKNYTFKNQGNAYTYTASFTKSFSKIHEILTNSTYTKTANGISILLSPKEVQTAKNNLNSVLYFATLPHKLKDKAVNLKYIETTTIQQQNYHVIQVTFTKQGGGDDYDDVFYYWIHTKTYYVDYLAYNYYVNGGGQRFRAAYNRRKINGIVFQDYINYKNTTEAQLKHLPKLLNTKHLKEVSKIELKAIKSLQP